MTVIATAKGGKLVYCISVESPEGKYYILCDKHPDFYLQAYFNEIAVSLNDKQLFENTIIDGLIQCPWCRRDEKKEGLYPNTRFPEGSEL